MKSLLRSGLCTKAASVKIVTKYDLVTFGT